MPGVAVVLLCRLLHFEVVDASGEMQPLDRLELIKEPLKLTGRARLLMQGGICRGSCEGWHAQWAMQRHLAAEGQKPICGNSSAGTPCAHARAWRAAWVSSSLLHMA